MELLQKIKKAYSEFLLSYPSRNSSGAEIPRIVKIVILFQLLLVSLSVAVSSQFGFHFPQSTNFGIYLMITMIFSLYYQSITYHADRGITVYDTSEFLVLTSIILFENIVAMWIIILFYMISHFIFGMRSPPQFIFNFANTFLSGTITYGLFTVLIHNFSQVTPVLSILISSILFIFYSILYNIQTVIVISRVRQSSILETITTIYDYFDEVYLTVVNIIAVTFTILIPQLYVIMYVLIFLLFSQQILRQKEIKSHHETQEMMQRLQHQREIERMRLEKLESLQTFAGKVAHDINNYLQIIMGNLEFIQNNENFTETRIDKIHTGLNDIKNIIKKLSNFASQESPHLVSTNLIHFVKDVTDFVLSDTGIEYEVVLDNEALMVEIDRTQIKQTISNILINAVEAIGEAEGKITVTVQKQINKDSNTPKAIVTIADTGSGIPEEYHDRIFTPYFTSKDKGTGLGIATANAILHAHGGDLDFVTATGVGTTFIIELPVDTTN